MSTLLKKIGYYTPTIGLLLFVGLSCFAAAHYPGGSPLDAQTVGFDWRHNYWCNLFNLQAINGAFNPARPFAIAATWLACLSLTLFFFIFSAAFSIPNFWKCTIRISGTIAMSFGALIVTEWHDLMTILSSVFGLFAVVGMLKVIVRSRRSIWQMTGGICLVLLGLNNYIYYTGHGLYHLASLQKITLLCVLSWIVLLNFAAAKQLILEEF
ncbi:MAG: hypothetical protein AB8G15_05180 [Saprospiraceae bacterium]